jgi:hypothetical protein
MFLMHKGIEMSLIYLSAVQTLNGDQKK